jgi:hypothetical protein
MLILRVQASFAVSICAAPRFIFHLGVPGAIGWHGFLFTELFELQARGHSRKLVSCGMRDEIFLSAWIEFGWDSFPRFYFGLTVRWLGGMGTRWELLVPKVVGFGSPASRRWLCSAVALTALLAVLA